MAKKINAKLVLELLGKGMSGREIARTRRISRGSSAFGGNGFHLRNSRRGFVIPICMRQPPRVLRLRW
jgi:hypothetical protein